MNVLLSIKPKYVELIKCGFKKYEFRRRIFRKNGNCRVFIYSTSPVKKIVGTFDVPIIYEGRPSRIWEMFGKHSGLSKPEFFHYFDSSATAFALEIKNFLPFQKPIDPSEHYSGFRPPQSYCYFNINQGNFPFAEGFS
jgi:type I restriction enzyme S subunit